MEIRHVAMTDPLVVPLLEDLAREYKARYGETDELSTTEPEEFDPPDGTFVVIVDDHGDTIAGGGLRHNEPGTAEVKRMWTLAAQRRKGHASRVLAVLESYAASAGYTRIVLETGPFQPEAIAMYARVGYHEIPAYGIYGSICRAFEKHLG